MTQDIMQLADTYADRFYMERRYHNEESVYDRAASRAALQSAVGALQTECEALAAENKELKLTIDVQAGSVEAVQEANNRLAAKLKELQEQEPVAIVQEPHMSRYTIEWTNGLHPKGTKLYTAPKALESQPQVDAAIKTLIGMGYTYHGGEQWKPPLGKPPRFSDAEQQVQGEAVYLVATGETHNGEETYCRYDYPPALAEFDRLYLNPKLEHLAEEAECVSMCLDDRGIPKSVGSNPLSLWGRVQWYADTASKQPQVSQHLQSKE